MSKLGIVEARRIQRLELIGKGYTELVKTAHGWWRPRISKKHPKSLKKNA